MSRDAARERVLTTLRFFWTAPQGPQSTGVTGYHGFYYHFLDMQTGLRFEQVELSTIDTALLLAGVLTCRQYFDGNDAGDHEVRALADSIYYRVDWKWANNGAPVVGRGWHAEATQHDSHDVLARTWGGSDAGMVLNVTGSGTATDAGHEK